MDFLHSRYKVHHQSCRPSQDAAPMNWKVSKYSFAAQFLEKHFWLTVTVWDFDLLDQCWIEDRRGETKARSNVSSPHWVKVENLHPAAWTAGLQEGCWCRELPFCEPDIFCISRKACVVWENKKTRVCQSILLSLASQAASKRPAGHGVSKSSATAKRLFPSGGWAYGMPP